MNRNKGSGIGDYDSKTAINGLLPKSFFAGSETFFINLRLVPGDSKLALRAQTVEIAFLSLRQDL
jgi:hypothetical protein